MEEAGSRKSEAGSPKAEARSPRLENRSPKAEDFVMNTVNLSPAFLSNIHPFTHSSFPSLAQTG